MQKLLAAVLIIIVGFLLISTAAQCEWWVHISTNVDGIKFYCDNDSIKKSILFGDTRKVRIKKETKLGSTRTSYEEYDCRNYKWRSAETKGWELIPPDSVIDAILNHVCQR